MVLLYPEVAPGGATQPAFIELDGLLSSESYHVASGGGVRQHQLIRACMTYILLHACNAPAAPPKPVVPAAIVMNSSRPPPQPQKRTSLGLRQPAQQQHQQPQPKQMQEQMIDLIVDDTDPVSNSNS